MTARGRRLRCGARCSPPSPIGAYLLSRATRRNWIGALAGIVPFVIVLYFFFQNVNRLLPAAL